MQKNNVQPRIIICGAGKYGQLVASIAIEKGWEVVGAYNRAGSKVGQDFGRLLDLNKDLGIIVEDIDAADFSIVDADLAVVAIHDYLTLNHSLHIELLTAGINVICHGTQSYFPPAIDNDIAAKLDAAGKANNATFTGGGIWDMSRIWLGLQVTGACTNINGMKHVSVSDLDRLGPTVVPRFGVGKTVDEVKAMLSDSGDVVKLYEVAAAHVMVGLGYTLKSTSEHRESVVFDENVYCKSMECEIKAGLCVGIRYVTTAVTEEGVNATAEIEMRLLREGETEHMSWEVDGKPGVKIRVERDDSVYFSAASVFNRIKQVIVAPSGLVTLDKLGPLAHSALD